MTSRILSLIKRILFWTVSIGIGLILLVFVALQIPIIQEAVRVQSINYLEKKLQTKVELENIDINILSHLKIDGLYIEDHEGDTLLFAGHAVVKIKSIDPFAKTVRLREIGLSHTKIDIYRHPDQEDFNYTFILDAFSSNSNKESKPSSLELSLNKIQLERVEFSYMDSLNFTGYQAYVHTFRNTFNKLSLQDKILSINKLEADACLFTYYKLYNPNPPPKKPTPGKDLVHIAPGDWIIEANELSFERSFFGYENDNKSHAKGIIDFNHLGLAGIDLNLEEIIYAGDMVQGYINQIATKEVSGFNLNEFQSEFFFTSNELQLQNLNIETDHSVIGNKIFLSYETLNDFNRLFTDVIWDAELYNTTVSAIDLSYFARELNKYKTDIELNLPVSGPLADLKINEGRIAVGRTAFLTGNFELKGLPIIDKTSLKIDIHPLVADIPSLDKLLGGNVIPEQIVDLGALNFKGGLEGTFSDLIVYGTAYSTIGDIATDMRMVSSEKGELSYTGSFSTTQLDAGILAGIEDKLGDVNMTATVSGSSHNGNNNVVFTSMISSIDWMGYRYQNINSSGELSDNSFDGRLRMNDPNGYMDFNGSIAIIDSTPEINCELYLSEFNLYEFNLYKDSLIITTDAIIDIKGNDLNDFLGDATISSTKVQSGNKQLNLDRTEIHSSLDNLIRTTTLENEYLNIDVAGAYRVDQLPGEFKALINYYLKGESFSDNLQERQNFEFEITATDIHDITRIFYPSVENLSQIILKGDFSSETPSISARISAKDIIYEGIEIQSLAAELADNNNSLGYFARASNIKISENLDLPVSSVEGNILNDSIALNLKMGRDIDPERINLYTGLNIKDSLLSLSVLPSEIYVNNEKWDIQPNNSISYNYKNFSAENFTLTSSGRELSVSSYNKGGPALKVVISNIPITDITTIAQYEDFDLEGSLNGNITISNPMDSLSMLGFITLNNLKVEGQNVGNLNITASKIHPNPKYNFNMIMTGTNSMRAYGYYHDSETDSLSLRAEITKLPFVVVEPFTKGLMSDLSGDAYGDISISGATDNIKTSGYLNMKNGGFKFDYLGTNMTFDFQKVELLENRIYLTPNKLYDEHANEGWISGNIYHQSFSNFVFDTLKFTSENFILMNATQKENPDFYGYCSGKASAQIIGPLEDLNIIVKASPVKSPQRENVVYIPAYGSGNVSRHNFIQFVDHSKTDSTKTNIEKPNVSIVNVSTLVTVTPDVEVRIPLSSSGSDDIKGKGYGDLLIDVNTIGKVDISGILKLTQGSYDFSFEGLSTKKFAVKEGGTIIFDQDPYQAKLNLTAVYRSENVQKLGLISDQTLTDQEIQEARKSIPVDVFINIGGVLEAPDISFDINLPDERGGDLSSFDQRLAEVKSDENELNKQVFGLLMLNQFLPKDLNAASAIGSSVNSSISDFITSQLSGYFSDWISEVIPNAEIDIGYQKIGSGDVGLEEYDQSQFEVGLKQKLFDDALTIKVGGTYSYETASGDPNAGIAGDFEVEYKIRPDGRVRVKAFRQSDFDAVASKNDTRTGLGLFYTKDFDTFSELFQNNRKKEN